MRVNLQRKCIWLAGASATAIMFSMPVAIAQDAGDRRLGTVLVTTQKTEESIQDVPIAVSAFDEDALENLQLAGGRDLEKSIPNVKFSKSNFGGFNFKIRGIGADLIATSGDAGVGIHQNDVPLTSSRLLEAEFFDVERVETLRGPQGTLYGRNATGGVVNVITAKPVYEEYQANVQLTLGNYDTVKAKGMVNLPLGDKAALRLAGSVLERDGFATNTFTGNAVDGRDLYGFRATLGFEPTDRLRGWISYDTFEENSNRARSTKQLCSSDPVLTSFPFGAGTLPIAEADQPFTTQGCNDAPLSQSFDAINSLSTSGAGLTNLLTLTEGNVNEGFVQSRDLRAFGSAFDPVFEGSQQLLTAKIEYDLTDSLLLTAIASRNETELLSVENYNRNQGSDQFVDRDAQFAAAAMVLPPDDPDLFALALYTTLFPGGVVDDPQLGADNALRSFDLQGTTTEQNTFEMRIQSDFDGPFNFNLGGIYLNYLANDDPNKATNGYYVFSNSLTAAVQFNNLLYQSVEGAELLGGATPEEAAAAAAAAAFFPGVVPVDTTGTLEDLSFTGVGGNYFRSLSPYELESFAIFGETYFDVTDDLTLTLGLRYTDDKKTQRVHPSVLFTPEQFLPEGGFTTPVRVAEQQFEEVTGRAGFDWNPDFAFSEDTLIYGFYSRGYKGGGINPPPATGLQQGPDSFDPEFIDSFEIGTKNTLAGGAMQLNATGFFYDYQGYQITQIVNRTSTNFNIDAEIQGIELEAQWSPVENLLLNLNVGWLDSEIQESFSLDLLDRTNGRDDMIVLKNPPQFTNCVVSAAGYGAVLAAIAGDSDLEGATGGICSGATHATVAEIVLTAANMGVDPDDTVEGSGDLATDIALTEGFLETALMTTLPDITYVDANGELQTASALTPIEGEAKNLAGNALPNTPESTINFGGQYTIPSVGGGSWDTTLRADYYYQAESFSRVYNTTGDTLESWDNLNLSIEFYNNDNDFSVELFGKNIADEDVITGSYLSSDDSGLFTNIFLNEPRTYGIVVTKGW